jgi:hypothetical protein
MDGLWGVDGKSIRWTKLPSICFHTCCVLREERMAFSRRTLFAALTVFALALPGGPEILSAKAQSTGKVYLPDPTPRDRDLHDRYNDSPALQEQQKRMAAMRRAQRQVAISADTNEILSLAKELRTHRLQHESSGTGPSDTFVAQKIESLAKRVRENVQSR